MPLRSPYNDIPCFLCFPFPRDSHIHQRELGLNSLKEPEMETITVSSIFISLICVIVVTGVLKAVNWVWLRPKKLERLLRQQGIPGSSYKLLFGDMKDFSSMRTQALQKPICGFSHDYLPRIDPLRHQLLTKFGDATKYYFLWLGPTPLVTISTPELIREATTKMQEFQKPKLNPIAQKLFPGLLSYEGEKWAKHRKIINPAFHVEKLKLMLPAFYESCAEMISKWEKVVAERGATELDLLPYLKKLSADVISRAAFGSSYEEGQRIFELLTEQTDLIRPVLRSVYIPGMRYIPTSRNRMCKRAEDQIHTLLRGIINKRREAIKAGNPANSDLLGMLLDSNLREIQQGGGDNNKPQNGMSLQEVIDECKLFYLAGQETTSILLVWTLILLSKHQEWQARAREEVLQTFGDSVPGFEGLNHLKTVTMILHEVLRLYPPVTVFGRRIQKDTKLGMLSLPAGVSISFPTLFVHHDKKLWGDDAEEFKPERFSEGTFKSTGGNTIFFPFGWGPRMCIGEKFALTEAKMALSMILQRFTLDLSPSYVHAPMTVIFLQPQHGAQIILNRL